MAKKRIPAAEGKAAVESFLSGDYDQNQLALATRFLLQLLEATHQGSAVEVRVPPFGAVQCIAGPTHSRGTPSNVVELGPETFIALSLGQKSFSELVDLGKIQASGNRSDLSEIFPIFEL